MESCEVRKNGSATAPAWMGLQAELRFDWTSLATATLVALVVCSTQAGLAEMGAVEGSMRSEGVTLLASTTTSIPMWRALAVSVRSVGVTSKVRRPHEVNALLPANGGLPPVTARATGAAIETAVMRGIDKSLEGPRAFRKRSNDLFRAQWALPIRNQEMLIRLRLRAKSRNAVSLELRF